MSQRDRALLTAMFDAAIAAADPAEVLKNVIPQRPKGRTIVVGVGKGAAQLARAFETLWDGSLSGVVVTRYGYAVPCRTIRVLEASHPVPDAAGMAASAAVLQAVQGLSSDDLVVALICGGGSALLPAPPDGLSLADEQELNRKLLSSGAPIAVMNAIRKHVSTLKGGRLAALAHPAQVISLVVSDVPGDEPAQIASGPTVPDKVTATEALALAENYGISLPPRIKAHMKSALAAAPDPDDPVFARNKVHIIASARQSLTAAAAVAEQHGVKAVILSDAIEGEARDVGLVHAAFAREVSTQSGPFALPLPTPVVLLSGGETTVAMPQESTGRGGRNTEFLLSLALGIDRLTGVTALAADTDGIDGSESNAGAFADGQSVARMRAAGLNPRGLLAQHDAWAAFDGINDLFAPGPTGTNVNDFRAILCRGETPEP